MRIFLFKIISFCFLFFIGFLCFVENVKAQEISLQENIEQVLAAEVTVNAIETDDDGNTDDISADQSSEPLQSVRTLMGDPQIEVMLRRALSKKVEINLQTIKSLFFTQWESNLLSDARKGFIAPPPKEGDINRAEEDVARGTTSLPRGPREISIGGIIYNSKNNWTVWINGQQIQPDRLPSEILDIQVSKEYVKLKWFDAYSNQIFPIKLKTHQRFNIDTRIFLPG